MEINKRKEKDKNQIFFLINCHLLTSISVINSYEISSTYVAIVTVCWLIHFLFSYQKNKILINNF
jgi:hypothetical protein